jgi:hypothetical protein
VSFFSVVLLCSEYNIRGTFSNEHNEHETIFGASFHPLRAISDGNVCDFRSAETEGMAPLNFSGAGKKQTHLSEFFLALIFFAFEIVGETLRLVPPAEQAIIFLQQEQFFFHQLHSK